MTKTAPLKPANVFPDLLTGNWKHLVFEAFRPGIEICELLGNDGDATQPSMALLRYAPGATVPLHRHHGVETILVLEGEQSDERGSYPAGTVVINQPDTIHSVQSVGGCVVLIQWDRPVEILASP
ncbi:MAG: cupin domain-containing protein [Burkholderiaceae bacterium]